MASRLHETAGRHCENQATDPSPPPADPRVSLAAERTLLAWIRTGLAMMGFGFVVARFGVFLGEVAGAGSPRPHAPGVSLWIGISLVLLGVLSNLLAAAQHIRLLGRIERGQPYVPQKWSLAILTSLVLVALGIGMTFYLVLLAR
jgi:putative membrane protein